VPILSKHFPDLRYAAALVGSGSEVLGFDTEMSSDHHWGPRLMMFLKPDDVSTFKTEIAQKLSNQLPREFRGYPTSFTAAKADDLGVQLLDRSDSGPINHRVEIMSAEQFFQDYLGFDITVDLVAIDWLSFPGQKLRSIASGKIYCDGIELEKTLHRFSYYPEDVWFYLLACGWARIEQEEHLMGRAGFVGDEVGSAIIAARLVRDLMNLCFLMERRYAPYPKWFGTAFQQLEPASALEPIFRSILSATSWQERQGYLTPAYEIVARRHNQLGITDPLPEQVQEFHGRPFSVISMGAFSKAICNKILQSKEADPHIKKLVGKPLIGSVEQFSDCTDLLADSTWRSGIRSLYSG